MPFDNFFFKENILFGQNQKKKKNLWPQGSLHKF